MCKTKYKDTIASERSLRVEKISTKNVEHKDYPARKDTDIKFQGYEFKIENNCFVKSAQEEKNKEQEKKIPRSQNGGIRSSITLTRPRE